MHDAISGSDVVVAIIGGTLLGLALTRPRFGWVQRLKDSSRSTVEALITVVAFAMGGYAYGSLYIVLHHHLEGDIDKLLRGAGAFFAVYALCVHFDPFSGGHGWQERASAIVLYITVALASILGGVVFVEYTLNHSVSGWPTLIWAASLLLVTAAVYIVVRRRRKPTADLANTESASPEAVPTTRETP
jgi:hypothetical protein